MATMLAHSIILNLLLMISFLVLTSSTHHLTCNNEGKFRIVQFTDAHFGESNIGDYLTTSLMHSILDVEHPDLVVLSGDIISGYTWNGKPGWFNSIWNRVVTPMMQRDIPWIFTSGNHDAEGELNRTQILDLEQTYSSKGSLTQTGFTDAESGQNIYFVDVLRNVSSEEHSEEVSEELNSHLDEPAAVARIWMIDSGMMDCDGGFDYFGCLQSSQMEWFQKHSAPIPGIVYMHIPPNELMKPMYFESNIKYPMIGSMGPHDLYCYDEQDLSVRFMDHMLRDDERDPNIMAIFHGHDHEYDNVMLYEDVLWGFGRKTSEGWIINADIEFRIVSGARVFEFDCDSPREWRTWIREKGGNQVDVTSYREMKAMEQKLPIRDETCDAMVIEDKKCQDAAVWKGWKPLMRYLFQHWLFRTTADAWDLFTRSRIIYLINDYIWEIGFSER